MSESRTVYVRVKPTCEFADDYVNFGEDGQSVTIKSLKKQKRSFLKHQISSYSFQFASILQNSDQQSLFNLTTKPSVDNALNGINSCIICNGGPGSGKTFTLNGEGTEYAKRGLIPRAIQYIFQRVATQPELEIKVRCSFIEFLNEQLFDVLNAFNGQPPSELKIVETKLGRISVKNLFAPLVDDEQSALERLFMGNAFRNINSNVHHSTTSVFTLWFDSDIPQPNTEKPLHSKIHFVDMASPVKFDTSNRESEEFHRQASINRTMTVLERVLIATDHVPFRSCPLTHFLKDSLPNRCIIAHVAFDYQSLPATLGTLKFASRVQGETSDDILNLKEHKESQIRRLRKEIDDMRSQLRVRNPQLPFCEPDRQEKQALSETVTSYLSDALQQFPVRSIYEIRAALTLMKEQYRAQKVSIEEQLREKYIFTVKPPEVNTDVTPPSQQLSPLPPEDGIAFFPLLPNNDQMWQIYKSLDGSQIDKEITEKRNEVSDVKKKKREVAIHVNTLKAKIDELKACLDEKEKNRLPPIDDVIVIDEEELHIREDLREVKSQYKEAYSEYVSYQNNEKELLTEIASKETELKQNFDVWLEEKQRQAETKNEEEEDNEELLDKEERREKKEYQKIIEQDPKAGPYFFATKKVQKILEREFRANGTRRQPVTE